MLKTLIPTLGRLRLFVQIAMLFFTLYGGAVVGHYSAERSPGHCRRYRAAMTCKTRPSAC